MQRINLYIIVLLLWPQAVQATHLIGGEMTYKCLGYNASSDKYTYEIHLIVYRDCGPNNGLGTFFDSTASYGIFQNGVLEDTIFVDYPGFFTLIDTQVEDPCATTPSDACVQKAEYISVVDLKFDGEPFDIAYQRCCRNSSVSNLAIPNETGMTLAVHIPVPQDGICNSSPVFNQLPPSFLCIDTEMSMDFSATDPDGDQLVYSLCTPLNGGSQGNPIPSPAESPPYYPVSWSSAYSESNPLGAASPVSLDPATGILTGTPTSLGIFSIGICVSEYRNGLLLSKIIRDYQVFIFQCPRPLSIYAEQNSIQFCEGLEITFDNISANAFTYFWDFGVESIQSDTSNEFEPTFLFPETGTYEVMLIAAPGNNCADTSWQTYFVQPPKSVDFDFVGPNCDEIITYSFIPSGTLDGGEFTWDFGNDINSEDTYPPDIHFSESGPNEVSLFYDISGCQGVVVKEVEVVPEVKANISAQLDSCIGLKLDLVNQSQNSSDFTWTVSKDDFVATSNQFEPVISVPEQGLYSVSLIAREEGACPDTTQTIYSAFPLMYPEFTFNDDTICFEGNSIDFSAGGAFNAETSILWDFGENSNISQSFDQQVQNIEYSEEGIYPVSLTFSDNGCVKTYTDSIAIFPNPKAFFSISDTNECMPVKVQFNNNSTAWTPLDFSWSFGDGNSSTIESPENTFIESGNYTVELLIKTTTGCIDQDIYQFPVPIEVYPLPAADFVVDPTHVQIESPDVYVTNYANDIESMQFIVGDLDTLYDDSFKYTFEKTGSYKISQIVENEFGCLDTAIEIVTVNGYLFYMPNAFSPNNDGVNDMLFPVVNGVFDYQIKIFDRWGKIVFQTNNPEQGWDGNGMVNGVYNYVVLFDDITHIRHKFVGSIMLLR